MNTVVFSRFLVVQRKRNHDFVFVFFFSKFVNNGS